MNDKLVLTLVTLLLTSVFVLAPESANANCKREAFRLKVFDQGLKITAGGNPTCLSVLDAKNVDTSFKIRLETPQSSFKLTSGQVHVVRVENKADCGSNLVIVGNPSNVDENDMIVSVKGINSPDLSIDNEIICFDVIVDGVGTIDPRARVVEENGLLQNQNIANEMDELIGAYETLELSDFGTMLIERSLDEMLIDGFDMSEAEARGLIREHAKAN